MGRMNIPDNIETFIEERESNRRYASFDYCFNYFRTFYEKGITDELASKDHLQVSCLHLGFYLASWGMYRGSSPLLAECSVKIYEQLIKEIAKPDTLNLWKIDVNDYTEENIERLMEFGRTIERVLESKVNRTEYHSDVLVTKILLGVFGNCPAFDGNFKKGMKKAGFPVTSFGEKSLKTIQKFYMANEKDFDHFKIPTIEFLTGNDVKPARLYTKAKLVDMAGFIEGLPKRKSSKSQNP